MSHLEGWHERLAKHFAELSEKRQGVAANVSVFALEHGLSPLEAEQLKQDVRAELRLGPPASDRWLLWVVYATEIGYRYDGDEYWQTFEASTPRWTEYGDRDFVRRAFHRFADTYRGARPTGAWADWFSIISWPITHAILPTDLQIQLARLLWETRYSVSKDALRDPRQFGEFLAMHAWRTTARFQNFAQNTHLLGLVAGALITESDPDSQYLLPATLERILTDLSKEQQAKQWLRDAQRVVSRLGVKGLWRGAVRPGPRPPSLITARQVGVVPRISLRKDGGEEWTAWTELPDLTELTALHSDLRGALNSSRAVVNGSDGSPLTRGRLLYAGQKVRLDRWPSDGPFLQLETGSAVINRLLAEECQISHRSPWLFHVLDDGDAEEVIGRTVRPGGSYLAIFKSNSPPRHFSWLHSARLACRDASAYEFKIDSPPDRGVPKDLETLDIGLSGSVEVRPIGTMPAFWDGDGHGEWIVGHEPRLGLLTSHELSEVSIRVDDEEPINFNESSGRQVIVALGDLAIGTHRVDFGLRPTIDRLPDVHGSVTVLIRPPGQPDLSGGYRDLMAIFAVPAQPTLDEIWSGRAAVELRGPIGLSATVTIRLLTATGRELVRRRFDPVSLPVAGERWRALITDVRSRDDFERHFDSSEVLELLLRNEDFGRASMLSRRAFLPLRWSVRADHEGPYLVLHRHLDLANTAVDHYSFDNPTKAQAMLVETEEKVRSPLGGLFIASVAGWTARAILAPNIRGLADLGQVYRTTRIPIPTPDTNAIRQVCKVAEGWALADDPGHFAGSARRQTVIKEFKIAISGALTGSTWMAAERIGFAAMVAALGDPLSRPDVRNKIRMEAQAVARAADTAKLQVFRRLVQAIEKREGWAASDWLPDALLLFADQPWSLSARDQNRFGAVIAVSKARPILLRLARCFVVAGDTARTEAERGSAYLTV